METKTIRQAVFSNESVAGIKSHLLDLPDEILKAKTLIVELETNLRYDTTVADAKQAVTDHEVEVAYEVTNETNGDNKKKFTNAEQRKDETRRQCVKSEVWVRLTNEVANALRVESQLKMQLGKAHARFAAIEAENHNLRSIAGMIAGLAHESTTTERIHRHTTTVRIGDNDNGN